LVFQNSNVPDDIAVQPQSMVRFEPVMQAAGNKRKYHVCRRRIL